MDEKVRVLTADKAMSFFWLLLKAGVVRGRGLGPWGWS